MKNWDMSNMTKTRKPLIAIKHSNENHGVAEQSASLPGCNHVKLKGYILVWLGHVHYRLRSGHPELVLSEGPHEESPFLFLSFSVIPDIFYRESSIVNIHQCTGKAKGIAS